MVDCLMHQPMMLANAIQLLTSLNMENIFWAQDRKQFYKILFYFLFMTEFVVQSSNWFRWRIKSFRTFFYFILVVFVSSLVDQVNM